MLLLIILLVLLFAGGGGYYGYSRWGTGGGLGIVGTVLVIVLVFYPERSSSGTSPDGTRGYPGMPSHEMAATVGLVALPIFGSPINAWNVSMPSVFNYDGHLELWNPTAWGQAGDQAQQSFFCATGTPGSQYNKPCNTDADCSGNSQMVCRHQVANECLPRGKAY